MMSKIATRRVQLSIDECKDWILHALELKEQYYKTIKYAADKKWEFLIVDYPADCFPDVKTLTKIEKVTGMVLIKTRK